MIDLALNLRYNVKKVNLCRVHVYLTTEESDAFYKKMHILY